jgi:geranylgeranyl reductase family protein
VAPGGAVVDVAVVGAGPAGATAALVLARAGLDVVLLDRAALPRDKTCGGGVVARALESLPPGVDVPVERRLGRVESRFVDAGLAVTVERDTALVHMARRAPLDLALAEAALAAGAVLRAPCALERVGLTPQHVELDTGRGPLRARFLIAADGATGPTARAAGWTEPPASVPALDAEVDGPPRLLARFTDRVRFDLGVPPGGYGWIFPKADHLSVGVGVFTRTAVRRRLRDELSRYLHAVGLGEARVRGIRGAPIPVRPRREVARGRVLLAGDAAGLADPLTGEGISFAILSGRLAAESLLADPLASRPPPPPHGPGVSPGPAPGRPRRAPHRARPCVGALPPTRSRAPSSPAARPAGWRGTDRGRRRPPDVPDPGPERPGLAAPLRRARRPLSLGRPGMMSERRRGRRPVTRTGRIPEVS